MNFIFNKIKKEKKILVKYFLLIFIISVFLINWNNFSWIFNYRAISGLVSEFFGKKFVIQALKLPEENSKEEKEEKEEVEISLKSFELTEKENSIEIPKIEITVPLIFPEKNDKKTIDFLLDKGAVFFPESVLPGNKGQTIILGHSAPIGWPKIKYDWIFTRLNELTVGDEIFINFENKKYKYLVEKKIFLERGEKLPQDLTSSENMLILISCWPPGKDYKRIAVIAK